jgi:acetoin utilization protein AcuB
MKPIPTVQKYMSTSPYTIGGEQTLDTAEKVMAEHNIRHLPVLSGGALIGIISDRDIKIVESFKGVDATKTTVKEACSSEPYVVNFDTPISEVCGKMAANRYGCALVYDNHKLVGIFSWIDALNAFNQLLETRLSH